MAFESKLNGHTNSRIHKIRKKAFAQFEERGFPTIKEEDWKYTSLNPVLKEEYSFSNDKEPKLEYKDVQTYLLHEIDTLRLVFIDGIFSSWLSNTSSPKIHIGCLCHGIEGDSALIKKYYNKAIDDPLESLPSLNTAFSEEGALIHIPEGIQVNKPIQIVYFTSDSGRNMMTQPRNLVVLGKNAEARVIERHQSLTDQKVLSNSLTEVFLEEGAQLQYYKVQNDRDNASLIDHTYVQQEAGSISRFGTYLINGGLVRNNLRFFLNGEYSEANMSGISLLSGRQHGDHHTLVDHRVPNCQSNELYKGIFDDHARGVFNGKVKVYPHAQKTNAFQQNDNVVLTRSAAVDTKPELEIYADDVKCSHGCTVGQLDEEALFYLKARGIPEKEAKAMLLYAFKHDVMSKVGIEALKVRLNRIMGKKLGVDLDLSL
jgi:Fe-S cluster assembly protein SufD